MSEVFIRFKSFILQLDGLVTVINWDVCICCKENLITVPLMYDSV